MKARFPATTSLRLLPLWRRATDRAEVALVLRYGIVGVAASAVYTGFVLALVEAAGMRRPVLASVIAFCLALPISYLGHWGITFRRPSKVHEGWGRFAATATTSFAGAVGGMYAVVQVAGMPYYVGLLWTWAVVPPLNFLALRLWVFASARVAEKSHVSSRAG
jgi:putative flippase GtrA